MRTQDEIVARINARKPGDFFGFETSDYLNALTFENAKQWLKPEVKEDEWRQEYKSDDDVRKQAIEYMPFAWEKANNERGISASRSMSHYTAWMWLLGEDGWDNLDDYEHYGKANLRRLCEYFGLDADTWDDQRRVNYG